MQSKKILSILILILIGTNTATLIALCNHIEKNHHKESQKIIIPDHQYGKFFRDTLNLTPQQHKHFKGFRRTYNQNTNRLLQEMESLRNEMVEILLSEQADRNKFDTISEQLVKKHQRLKGYTFDYFNNMRNVLDEEQKEKIILIFETMLTSEGFAKTPHYNKAEHEQLKNTSDKTVDRNAEKETHFEIIHCEKDSIINK